ncbi:MAG TPA: RidA family protein [Nitrosopumilaceae archaeon]|nr:RidA family protein [Nitrosopumilaceae archaeon]
MIDDKLKSLNITLPTPPKPAGAYIPVVISDQTVYVSGQIPLKDGKVVYKGKIPKEQTLEHAQMAAKLCIINALAQLKAEIGSLDRISKIIKVSGFVNSEPDFTEHPQVINAASNLLFEIFGQKGQHSRIAVGVASLPFGSTVEIDMILEIN